VQGSRDASEGYTPGVASTGSKIAVPLKDLPMAVVVVPNEVIAEQAGKTMNQVLSNVSNVQPVYGGGYGFADSYVIRGLRMRFLRDGVADGPALINYARSFADVQSVEVLKGPGSAVYGSSAPGGVVNVTSKQPSKNFGAAAELSFGGLGLRQVTGDVTGALSDDAAARLIFNDYHTDGIRGLAANIRELTGKLDYRINAANKLSFGYEHRENNNVVDNYGILFNTAGQVVNAPKDARYYSPFNKVSQTIDRFSVIHDLTISGTLSLRNAASYDQRKIDIVRNAGGNVANAAGVMTGRNGRVQKDNASYTNVSSELTWKIPGAVPQTVLFGTEYEVIRNTTSRFSYSLPNITNVLAPVVPETALAGLAQTRVFDKQIGANTLSLYAQNQLEFSKQWKARAGLRIDRAKFFDDGIGNSLTVPTVTNVYRKLDAAQTLPSWQLGMVYQPSNDLSFFAGANKGRFLNIQTESVNLDRQAERSGQIELGAKTTWLNEKLNVNVTYFETTRNDYLVALTAGADPLPVGQAKSKGFEIDVMGNPLPGWNVVGAFGQIDARSTGNERSVINGITTAQGESVNGKQLTATPRTALSFWNTFQLQTGDFKGLGFGAGFVRKGESYADSLEKLKVPGYTVYNASVFYKVGKSEVALNLKNLTNAQYFSVPTFSGALPGEPRQLLLTLRTKF
jgi:iron complex outermembrane recepter protein